MVLFFLGYESLSKGYNVLNEFMFQSHMRFCRVQWLPTRLYGSLSVYSPLAAQLKIAFRRFLLLYSYGILSPTDVEANEPAIALISGCVSF